MQQLRDGNAAHTPPPHPDEFNRNGRKEAQEEQKGDAPLDVVQQTDIH
jgi:hypothetical protein